MALVIADRVQETSTTSGTGTLTLAGAVAGYQSFAVIGNGNDTYYTIVDPITNDWEVGFGTYTSSGTTLSRTTVLASSNANALVPFAANPKNVFVTYPAGRAVYENASLGVDLPANLNFSGSAARITGDFSNGTLANRVMFQTSTVNSYSLPVVIPNGTSKVAGWMAYTGDTANESYATMYVDGTTGVVNVQSGKSGTGTYLPMTFYTGGSERMRVDTSGNVGIGTSSPNYTLEVNQSGGATIYSISDTAAAIGAFRYSNDTGQAQVVTRKARGTQASPSAVQTGDVIGQWVSQAYGGTNWRNIATIDTRISNYTSDTNISSFITFSTNNASTNVSERARIDSSGNFLITSEAALGYGTGAGGTVTQGTSKSTGVTLNKPTGQITMNAAALAASANVSFTLTNSFITTTSVIVYTHVSGGTLGSYFIRPYSGGNGSATVNVANISAGSLSEAIVIQFCVIRGATA